MFSKFCIDLWVVSAYCGVEHFYHDQVDDHVDARFYVRVGDFFELGDLLGVQSRDGFLVGPGVPIPL